MDKQGETANAGANININKTPQLRFLKGILTNKSTTSAYSEENR